MSETYDLIVRGGICVTPNGIALADIGTRNGRIESLSVPGDASAAEVLDATGLHVLPGVIDTQVHFREPGGELKEDLESGCLAAVLGGVTAVFEMPNTNPATTNRTALADKLARAGGRARCDIAFFVGATHRNIDELAGLERLPGCCGVKLFMGSSTGGLLVADDESVEAVLRKGTRRVAVHSEDEERLVERRPLAAVSGHPRDHTVWRDEVTAFRATRRLMALARRTGRRVHVLHVTTAEEMAVLADNKDLVTVEVTPQHLTLEAPECYERLGTYAQMNPPIRGAAHRESLWAAVRNGVVDVIPSPSTLAK